LQLQPRSGDDLPQNCGSSVGFEACTARRRG